VIRRPDQFRSGRKFSSHSRSQVSSPCFAAFASEPGYPSLPVLGIRSPERTGQHQTCEKLSAAMNHRSKLLVGAEQASPSKFPAPSALRLWLRKRLGEDARVFVCGKDGIVNLNSHLIFAPKTVLECAVVHELCHLRYRHHERAFWKLLGHIIPDSEVVAGEERAFTQTHRTRTSSVEIAPTTIVMRMIGSTSTDA
jgi:hypothetical protein